MNRMHAVGPAVALHPTDRPAPPSNPQLRRKAKLNPKKVEDIFDDTKMWQNAQKTTSGGATNVHCALLLARVRLELWVVEALAA